MNLYLDFCDFDETYSRGPTALNGASGRVRSKVPETLGWPQWPTPDDEDILVFARIVAKYSRFLHRDIVKALVADNTEQQQHWSDMLHERATDPQSYLWDHFLYFSRVSDDMREAMRSAVFAKGKNPVRTQFPKPWNWTTTPSRNSSGLSSSDASISKTKDQTDLLSPPRRSQEIQKSRVCGIRGFGRKYAKQMPVRTLHQRNEYRLYCREHNPADRFRRSASQSSTAPGRFPLRRVL